MENTNELLKQILENTTYLCTQLQHVNVRLSHLEEKIESFEQRLVLLEERISNLEQRLTIIENKLIKLEQRMLAFEERLALLENAVTRIEIDHGEKLQILFDYFISNEDKFKNIQSNLALHSDTLQNHESRIYLLESHKKSS